MCCARDAGIVIPHRLFALPCDLPRPPARSAGDEGPQVLLDALLILRRRRNDARRFTIRPASSNSYRWYRMPRGASLHPWPTPALTSTGARATSGGSYSSMMRSASSHAYTSSSARTTMLWNGLRQGTAIPLSTASCWMLFGQPVEIEVETRQRALHGRPRGRAACCAAHSNTRRASRRNGLQYCVDRDVEPLVRNQAALADRVLLRRAQRHELVVLRNPGKSKSFTQRTASIPMSRACRRESVSRSRSGFARRLVEAAGAHRDRVDLAAADDGHQLVAGLLRLETAP